MKMKRIINVIIGLAFTLNGFAQEFKYEAKIDPVKEKGYYKIALSPQLLGKLNLDVSDLRIVDTANNEVPYFISQEKESTVSSNFISYTILERYVLEDSTSFIVFHNSDRKKISKVTFIVKNTDVRKRASLSGSNDRENWFVVKENYLLHSMNNDKETTDFKLLDFPLSDYEFFKLEMVDKNQLPINILDVGYYDSEKSNGNETEFNFPIVSSKDSANSTFIKIALDQPMYLEQLTFNINAPEFYSRSAVVKVKQQRVNSKKKVITHYSSVGRITLNSNSENVLRIEPQIIDSLYIEIENGDDAPIELESIHASYLTKYAVSELSSENSYLLKFGDEELKSPSYDLFKFKDKMQLVESAISHQEVYALTADEASDLSSSIFDNPLIVWSVLGLVGLLLGFISFKMIREMK